MTRAPVRPPAHSTLHLIGDLHVGQLSTARQGIVTADLHRAIAGSVVARVQLGDMTHDSWASQDAEAVAFLDGLSAAPWYAAVGNHDITGGRNATQAAQAWGMPGASYTVDLPFGKLIALGPEPLGADGMTMVLSPATLDWLDDELTAAGDTPCFLACHAPLYDTVGAGQSNANQFTSTDPGLYVVGGTYADRDTKRDADVRDVIAAHSNVKAWLSGHTHSPWTTSNLASVEVIGGRSIACINASSLWYVGKSYGEGYGDPLRSVYMTWLEDRIDVRFRNHGVGAWDSWSGSRVLTLPLT